MNAKARFLGMSKTTYANSHGLVNQNNKSTAFDISVLTEHALKNNRFREVVSCKRFVCQIKVG